jgi:hypothetical protein
VWNRAERALRNAYRAGTLLDLGGRRAGSSACVRAEIVAELLLAGPSPRPGRTARVDLAGARIAGCLDLTGAMVDAPIRLRHCVFDAPIVLDHAELGSVDLDGSELPAISAESLQVGRGFGMRNAHLSGDGWLHHIRVGGGLDIDGTRFDGPVNLQRAVIEADARLGHGAKYLVGLRLDGARIAGDLNLAEATACAPPDGAAISGFGVTAGGGLWAHDLVAEGTVLLVGIRAARSRFSTAACGIPTVMPWCSSRRRPPCSRCGRHLHRPEASYCVTRTSVGSSTTRSTGRRHAGSSWPA